MQPKLDGPINFRIVMELSNQVAIIILAVSDALLPAGCWRVCETPIAVFCFYEWIVIEFLS